ncbi:MAG: hypothetical protein HYX74_02010 [Acidobacteria bacterium]|nr:hypothetical protein [Acidobacteriota bacterium]
MMEVERIRLLIVEHGADDLALLRESVQAGMPTAEVHSAGTATEALSLLEQNNYDILVLDQKLAGLGLLRRARSAKINAA